MEAERLAIPEVMVLKPQRFADDRGFFSETYSRDALRGLGVHHDFVQENHSFSRQVHTLRGLHYQTPPKAQAKLVRVVRGRIWDVAVDVRLGSPTYGQWVSAEISAEGWNQIYIPVGFAHGFCTLEPDTEVVYLVSEAYSRPHDAALRWDDRDLAIDWPLDGASPILSDKDRTAPSLRDLKSPFAA